MQFSHAHKNITTLAKSCDLQFDHFFHDVTTAGGNVATLSSTPEISQLCEKENLPLICFDKDQGRILDPGVYFDSSLLRTRPDFSEPYLLARAKFPLGRTLNIFRIGPNGHQQMFCFAFNLEQDAFYHHVLNNHQKMNVFIDSYWKEIGSEFSNTCNFRSAFGFPRNPSTKAHSTYIVPHRETRLPVRVSFQKSMCLRYLANGLSFKEIAREMNLSPRTVEHYVYAASKATGCRSTCELVAHLVREGLV